MNKLTIIDYVKFRGDLSFKEREFNVLDALVLSSLAYLKLDGLVDECGTSLNELYRRYLGLGRLVFDKGIELLFRLCSESERYGKHRVFAYVSELDVKNEAQFSAFSFEINHGLCFVAFRGTDGSLLGWKENFNMVFMERTFGQELAGKYLDENFAFRNRAKRLILGGHSKGGNFAISAALYCKKSLLRRVEKIYSFDGPGFCKSVVESERYSELLPKIKSILPSFSTVGILMYSKFTHSYVSSFEKGINQHNMLSWELDGLSFKELESNSEKSILFDKVMHKWMNSLSVDERRMVVQSLYDMLLESSIESVDDMFEHKLKTVRELTKRLSKLPKEENERIKNAVLKLKDAGFDAFLELACSDKEQGKIDRALSRVKKLYELIVK